MNNPYDLETTAHLVAHLLREIESALRSVFQPVTEGSGGAQATKPSQKENIRAILRSLNIDEKSSEAQAWLKLSDNLHSVAHRRGLDAPRSLNEISELWDQSQPLLDMLLKALREHFLAWIHALDGLLAQEQPTKEDLKCLTQEIPNNAITHGYFFDRLETPEWLEPLRKRDFFKHPPQPECNEEEGTIRFPPWPEAHYLARMAQHKPELVAQIIQEMDDTDNAAVISDLVDALLAMPVELISAGLVEKTKRWAECPYLLVPEKVGQVISHLAKGGKTEEAMAVARVLLDVFPDPRHQQAVEEPSLSPEPQARFHIWHYKQILKEHFPYLVREAGLPALALLCDLLDKAICLSGRHGNEQGDEDYSRVWRPAVEDHSQNLSDTLENALVSAIRDAAELVVRSGRAPVEEVVNVFERRGWKIFKRIALHIIRVFPNQATELATVGLTDRTLFEDVGLRYEYTLLLRDRFPRLFREDQAKILGWIEEGPKVDQWKQRREKETGTQPSEEEVTRYRELWQRDWLARIGPENLPVEWQEHYREFVGEYGKPEYPEFSIYSEGIQVGPTSPKTVDDLKAMSVTEIVEFLKVWSPPQNVFLEPSPEGLGRVLSSVVADDPERFADEAQLFQGLDPTYVRAVLSGLRDAAKQDKVFNWEPVLELCAWVLSQPQEIEGRHPREIEADLDWSWTRKVIADLLSAGFEDRQSSIPISLRQRVWDILKPLTDDPDPTPEYEQRYGGSNMDPATLSINTTRGEAMHTVIRYALWVRRHMEKETDKDRVARGFSEMPEVREVLDAHLDPAREPSLAIRAVYGQWFPWLVLLDPEWARAQMSRIFPQDPESTAFFEAAWNTYIVFCHPYDNVWEILRPFYRMAVNRIGVRHNTTRWLADPDEKLAEHLMAFYRRGKLSLDDPLLVDFWKKAPDDLRAHALMFVGQSLKHTEGDISEETLKRLVNLWENRLGQAPKSQPPGEFEKEVAAFGWWFVSEKFNADWSLEQLSASLQTARKIEPVDMVLEQLAKAAQTHPLKSVECLRIIVEAYKEGWELHAGRDNIRQTLHLGLGSPNARQEAERVVQYLCSIGFLDFEDLSEGKHFGESTI